MSPCPEASDRLGGARASEGLRAGGRGLDRRRGAAALGSRPSARPGEGRSTGCLSPLPSLFHLRPRPQGPGRSHSSSKTLVTGRDDGRGRRTKRGTKRARQTAANDPRGRAARPGPGARGSHSAPGRRLPSPQTLLMSERRDRPRWGRAGRVRPQGACQASVRPRAAAGRRARRGPRWAGAATPASYAGPCSVAPLTVAFREQVTPGGGRRGVLGRKPQESPGDSRAAHGPCRPRPHQNLGWGRPRWRFPQAARATPAHAA